MIWTEQTSGNLTVEYNFGEGVWTMQKNVLRVSVAGASESVQVTLELDELITYQTNNSGRVLIDLSDYLRTIEQGESVTIAISYNGDLVTISADIVGLIDPLEMIIPPATRYELLGGVLIAPPHKWLEPLFGLSDSVEFYIKSQAQSAEFRYSLGSLANVIDPLSAGLNELQIPTDASGMNLRCVIDNVARVQRYTRSALLCGRTYAAVEWLSRAGTKKRHTLEVVRVTYSTDGATEFQSALGFDVMKGQAVGFTLRLQGLTRYDYWYYCDIITSNDVRVALVEADADFGDETRVQVVASKAVIPDGAGAYDLEIEVKYKRYDDF